MSPARQGDIAQVAPAVDEDGPGKHGGEQPEVDVVIGHLIDDPFGGSSLDQALESMQVLLGQLLDRPRSQREILSSAGPGLSRTAGIASNDWRVNFSSPAPKTRE